MLFKGLGYSNFDWSKIIYGFSSKKFDDIIGKKYSGLYNL